MKEYIIELPIRIRKNKHKNKQHYGMNLNEYRNWHYQTETNIKRKYKDLIKSKLPEDLKFNVIEIETQFYFCNKKKNGDPTKARKDKGNFYAIILKYFLDALVEEKILEDDNDNYIKKEVILPTMPLDFGEEEKVVFKLKELEG